MPLNPPLRYGTRTPSTYLSRPQTPKSPQTSNIPTEKEDAIHIEAAEINENKDEFVDPEAANIGHAKRPMILTHSVMVGLALILLIVVEAIVISNVRLKNSGKLTIRC
jgi:hypothetical protein